MEIKSVFNQKIVLELILDGVNYTLIEKIVFGISTSADPRAYGKSDRDIVYDLLADGKNIMNNSGYFKGIIADSKAKYGRVALETGFTNLINELKTDITFNSQLTAI